MAKWVTCYECTGMGKISSTLACENCGGKGGWTIDFELLADAPDMAARIAELAAALRLAASVLKRERWIMSEDVAAYNAVHDPRLEAAYLAVEQALSGAEEEA